MKNRLKEMWTWFWSKTTIDEQVQEDWKETKRRVRRVKEELQDVQKATKEVADQARDVLDAVKGSKRKGPKPTAKK